MTVLVAPSVLVLTAMAVEAEALVARIEGGRTTERGGLRVSEGRLGPAHVTVAVTGIGKVAAARACQRLLAEAPRSLVLVGGISGGLDARVPLGALVIGEAAVQHDFDARPLVAEPGVVPELGLARLEAAAEPTRLLRAAADAAGPGLGAPVHSGLLASGDAIVRSAAQRERILEHFPDALAVDMETAAIAHVARLEGVPWAAVRVISDTADEQLDIEEVLGFAVRTAGTVADVLVAAIDGTPAP